MFSFLCYCFWCLSLLSAYYFELFGLYHLLVSLHWNALKLINLVYYLYISFMAYYLPVYEAFLHDICMGTGLFEKLVYNASSIFINVFLSRILHDLNVSSFKITIDFLKVITFVETLLFVNQITDSCFLYFWLILQLFRLCYCLWCQTSVLRLPVVYSCPCSWSLLIENKSKSSEIANRKNNDQ